MQLKCFLLHYSMLYVDFRHISKMCEDANLTAFGDCSQHSLQYGISSASFAMRNNRGLLSIFLIKIHVAYSQNQLASDSSTVEN